MAAELGIWRSGKEKKLSFGKAASKAILKQGLIRKTRFFQANGLYFEGLCDWVAFFIKGRKGNPAAAFS